MFSRTVEAARIGDLLLAGKSVNLIGSRWSGRSEILSRVRQRLLSHERQVIVVRGIGREIALEAIRVALPSSIRRKLGPRAAMVGVVTDELESVVHAEPTVFLVDDADQLDRASWVVLESIHKSTGAVVLATDLGRASTDSPRQSLMSIAHPVVQIALDDLRLGSIHDLLEGRVDGPLDPALAVRIHTLSGGSPGIALAVVDSAVTTGLVRRVDGVWRGGPNLWSEDLNGVFESLLSSHPPALRAAAEMLAIVGVTDWGTAERVVGQEVLEALENNGLMRVVATDGRTMVAVHPAGIVDYYRNQPVSTRRMSMIERVSASLGAAPGGELVEHVQREWGNGGVDADLLPLRRAAELPMLARMFTEDFRMRVAAAERQWRDDPTARTAADVLLISLTGRTDAALIEDVLERGLDLPATDPVAEVELRWLMARARLVRGEPVAVARRQIDQGIRDGFAGNVALATMSDALRLELGAATDVDVERLRAAASGDEVTTASATIALVAALVVGGDGAGALAALDAADGLGRTPFADTQIEVLRGLALAADGQYLAATRWATGLLERAIADLDRLALVGHAFVAALGLASLSRYQEASDIASIPLRMEAAASPLLLAPDRAILVLLWAIAALDGRSSAEEGFAAATAEVFAGSRALPFGEAAWGQAMSMLRDGRRAQARESFGALADDLAGHGFALAADVARFLASMSSLEPDDSIEGNGSELFAAHLAARRATTGDDARGVEAAAERLAALHVVPAAVEYLGTAARLYREANDADAAARVSDRLVELAGGRREAPGRRASTLTTREAEVVRLIASGLSNAEIAARLVISIRTVESHINNVRRRTGLTDRGEIGRLSTFV